MTITVESVAKTMANIRRNRILNEVHEVVSRLIIDDRKNDEDLPRGAIENAVVNGDITIDEIVDKFKEELASACK